jgi:hypothetical protein
MAVKTITIDMEAYTLLFRRKEAGQSFSDVIKARFGPDPTAAGFLRLARKFNLSDDALDAMDRVVADRASSPARAVKR